MYSEMSCRECQLNEEERGRAWDEFIRMLDPVSPMQDTWGWYTPDSPSMAGDHPIRIGWDTRAEPYIPT